MLNKVHRSNRSLPQAAAVTALFCYSGIASAKLVGHYDVALTPQSQNGQMAEFLTAMNGWTCSSTTSMNYSEVMVDQKGNSKRVPKSAQSNWSWNTLWTGNSGLSTKIAMDHSTWAPQLDFALTENCNMEEVYYENVLVEDKSSLEVVDRDDRGKRIGSHMKTVVTGHHYESQRRTRTHTMYKTWNCGVSTFPKNPGESSSYTCKSNGVLGMDAWMSSITTESIILSYLRDKDLRLDLRLSSYDEQFAFSNCTNRDDLSNRRVYRINQGVVGHMGENDFEFNINFETPNASNNTSVKSESGLLSEDFALCISPEALDAHSATLDISAVERDLIWDDIYAADGKIDLAKVNSERSQKVTLHRKSYLGKKTKYDSDVKVELIEITPPSVDNTKLERP